MTVDSVLADARAFQEQRFTEMITVGRFTETVGEHLETVRTIVGEPSYTGPAQVKYPSDSPSDDDAVGQQFSTSDVIIKVPFTSNSIEPGESILVTASTVDVGLVNRFYRVKARPQAGQTSAHRYPVEEVS